MVVKLIDKLNNGRIHRPFPGFVRCTLPNTLSMNMGRKEKRSSEHEQPIRTLGKSNQGLALLLIEAVLGHHSEDDGGLGVLLQG